MLTPASQVKSFIMRHKQEMVRISRQWFAQAMVRINKQWFISILCKALPHTNGKTLLSKMAGNCADFAMSGL
jgi:hypothetical protein